MSTSRTRWCSSPAARAASGAHARSRFAQGAARRVVLNYAGNEAAAAEALGSCSEAGAQGEGCRFDVADTAACADGGRRRSSKELGRLDVLVNNAGIAIDGLVMRVKDEDWDQTLDRRTSRAPSPSSARSPGR